MRREHNETVRRGETAERAMKKINQTRAANLKIVSTHLSEHEEKTLAAVVNATFTTISDPTPEKSQLYDYNQLEALLHSDDPIIPENLFPAVNDPAVNDD
jgi:hypothetical protein